MDAGKRSINDIFNGNRLLEIPFFQRAYVWGEDQWERFLADMVDISQNDSPYFIGAVILKQKSTSSDYAVGDVRTVIDGQQRLTTICIFFKVLCLKTNTNHIFERPFQLHDRSAALRHNHNDVNAFDRIVHLKELKEMEGTDNITMAYRYFMKNLDAERLSVDRILRNLHFVGIDLDANEDEQQIFDTINSLGVRLTTAELLKNHLFGRNDLEDFGKYWKEVFEKDEETKKYWDKEVTTGRMKRSLIDLFLMSVFQIKIQDKKYTIKGSDKTSFSKVEHLFDSYKRFIRDYLQGDKAGLLEEMKELAKVFRANFDNEILKTKIQGKPGIERINLIIFGLDTTTLLPYALYVLKNVTDEKVRTDLFEFIETYVLRRIVTQATTKNYNQLFAERLINNEILSKDSFISYLSGQVDKVNYLPTNEELKTGFNKSILVNKQAAGVLYMLESRLRNDNYHTTPLGGLSNYSLEHLMPKKWENNWAPVSDDDQRTYRNRKLLTLGNLVIITQPLNSSLRDAEWEVKVNGRKEKDGLRHFATGLETTKGVFDKTVWDEQAIEERAEYLFNKAADVWRIIEVKSEAIN